MKRKHILFVFTILTSATLALTLTNNAEGNVSGAPGGNTGAPGDATCAKSGCHSGNTVQQIPGLITTDIPTSGYVPGETYTITATANNNGGERFGFQVTAKDGAAQLAGTFTAINTNTKTIVNKYITHTLAGSTATDTKAWTFEWTAPQTATGDITFYGAFNLANNDGNSFGDQIVTSSRTVSKDPTASVSFVDKERINIYPSPFNNKITFDLPAGPASVEIYNVNGEKVTTLISENGGALEKELGWLENGIYFVLIKTDYNLYSQRIVKVL